MISDSEIQAAVQSQGFPESGFLPASVLVTHDEVRHICEGNGCGHYGKTWACPPAVGSLEECREKLRGYTRFLLFCRVYVLEDSFDYEGMMSGLKDFQTRVDRLDDALRGQLPGFLLLSNEGCGRCAKCTYPDAPCRFPEKLHPSLEGFGFLVSDLAKAAGMPYIHGADTVTFFGMLAY